MRRALTREPSLLRRTVMSNLLLVGLCAVALTAWYAVAQRAALDQQLRLRAETLTDFLATQSQFGMLVSDREGLQRVADNALTVEDVLFVELRDAAGQPLASVSRKSTGGAPFLEVSRPVSTPGSGGLVEWENRKLPGNQLGTVRVGFSMERQARLLRRTIEYGIAALVTCLLAILGAQYYQLRWLLKPLGGLIEFAGQVGKGDLKRRAPVGRLDEIGRLAVAFNRMVDELGSITVSKNYVENILESMDASVIVVDADRRIHTVNQAAVSLLGYTQEQLIGQPAALIFASPEEFALPASGVERVYRLKDGRDIPVLFSAASLTEQDGAGSQVWLARDISERKRAEEELRVAKQEAENASRAKSELLSRTSHELRTPLNAILGFAQLLEMGDLMEMDRGNVGHIMKAGRHLLRLINEVLDIAGVESGRRTLSCEPVLAGDAVAEALDLVRPMAANRDVAIHDSVDGGQYVMADRQRLQQVLLNLLSNAVKYNSEGGSVFLDSEQRPNGFVRIRVRDTGPGISPEGMAKLFVPFERLGAEQSGVEGTGLGLSFAKTFMEAMGGSVGVSSIVGKGTTFWIDVPPAEAPAAAMERLPEELTQATIAGPAMVRHRLLYVEDNSSNRELVERIMTYRPGIDLTMAMGGEHGITAARAIHPDLILLDLHLPDIWGDEVLKRLKRDPATSSIPVVMLSADATKRQIQRLLSMGADAYLTKPIDVHQLLAILDEKLQGSPVPC